MTDTSGRKCLELSKLSGPAGSLERTLLATSLWASTRCYLTWRAVASPAGATLYRLSPQMPHTDETGAGLWPTPDASDRGPRSADLVVNQSTVQRRDSGQKRGIDLQTAAKLWPTPDTRGFTNDGSLMMLAEKTENRAEWDAMSYRVGPKQKNRIWPTDDPKATEKNRNSSGSLNPNWVEWLMGYPVGYTDLNS